MIKIRRKQLKISNAFIAGFFCGEGYLGIYCTNKEKEWYTVVLGIHMNLRDKELLEEIQKFVGLGKVRITTNKSNITSAQYVISKKADIRLFLQKILPHCRGYKRGQIIEFLNKTAKLKINHKKK